MKKSKLYSFLIVILILTVDRIIKFIALNTTYIKNYGLVFGILFNPSLRWIFVFVISLIFLFFIYLLTIEEVKKDKILSTSFLFIIAGLLGNLIDRIFYGFVIDFIKLPSSKITLTAFNISDISIVIGIFLIIITLPKKGKIRK